MNGQTLPLSRVLRASSAIMGIPWSDDEGLDAKQLAIVTPLIGNCLTLVWEDFAWPELRFTARRYRPHDSEWRKLVGTNTWPANTVVFHRDSNAIFIALKDAGADSIPGVGAEWSALLPIDPNHVLSYDPAAAYKAGDTIYYPGAGVLRCLEDTSGLPEPSAPIWGAIPETSGEFPYDPGVPAPANRWALKDRPMGSVIGVWTSDPSIPGADPLGYELGNSGVRVQGDPGSAWFRWIDPTPQITGAPWDSAREYLRGDQFYYQTTPADGTWYDVLDTLAAGQTPAANPDKVARVTIPARMLAHLTAALAAAWLRFDGQVDKAADQDKAATSALMEAQLLVAQKQQQTRRLPVSAR